MYQHESPQILAKRKAKVQGIPPLPPKSQQSGSFLGKMKVETMTNFNNNNGEQVQQQEGGGEMMMLIHNQEEGHYTNHIEEDINADTTSDTDGDLYQVPINGGIPIKVAFRDSSRRPFTPPFQQIVKMQQRQQ